MRDVYFTCFNFLFSFYYIFVIYYLLFSIYFFISDGCASESYVGRHFSFSKFPSNSCTAVTGVSWIFKNATGKMASYIRLRGAAIRKKK
jgi:hypothetical protein